jgi:RNA polymerase sigma-B factor
MVEVRCLPAGAPTPAEIAEPLDDAQSARLLAEYARTRDPHIRNRLALHFDRVVHWLVKRFVRPNVPIEDLLQVGRIGLLQALDRFDPMRGTKFVTYAVAMISGEIKHYFRDVLWDIRVPREMQDLYRAVPHAEDELRSQLGRAPTISEVAAILGICEERIAAVMELGSIYHHQSLNTLPVFDDWDGSEELQDRLGTCDTGIDAVIEFSPLRDAMERLDERKRWIIRRRFFEEWSQNEVARELGISQMHVSRLEREALRQLRRNLTPGL